MRKKRAELLLVKTNYKTKKKEYEETLNDLAELDRLLSRQLTSSHASPYAIKQYLRWLNEVEAQNHADLNHSIESNQYRSDFAPDSPDTFYGPVDPYVYMENVKAHVRKYRNQILAANHDAKQQMDILETQLLDLQHGKRS